MKLARVLALGLVAFSMAMCLHQYYITSSSTPFELSDLLDCKLHHEHLAISALVLAIALAISDVYVSRTGREHGL